MNPGLQGEWFIHYTKVAPQRDICLTNKNELSLSRFMRIQIRAIPEKIPGRGRRQAIYFSMGGWCGKLSNYMGKKKQLFVAFPWVETSTGPGGFMICVFINMTGTPEGSTESGFMEKPGIEPATPGLQGIALIHYTTGASQKKNFLWLFHG